MYKNIIILLSALFFVACGGGGGGSDNTTTNPSNAASGSDGKVSLSKIQSTENGTVYAALLKGAWFSTALLNGVFTIVNEDKVQLNGSLVTPHDMKLDISILGGNVGSIMVTSYIDESGNVLSMKIKNGNVICLSSSSMNIPTVVSAGDVGVISTFSCDNNKTGFASWSVNNEPDNNFNIINNVIVKDKSGSIFSNTDAIFTLDANGNIVSLKLVIKLLGDNLSLTLDSV